MKFTIELSAIEVIGLKDYLKEVNGVHPSKPDLQNELQNIVSGYINSSQVAISDYIRRAENILHNE